MRRAFEIIARAAVVQRGKILLCRRRGARWYFLPGGHIEFGSKAKDTLIREFKEELGVSFTLRNNAFIGALENTYRDEREPHHELNLIFAGKISGQRAESRERHIEFLWMRTGQLRTATILPVALN